jgi:hypothetical protein
MEKNSLRFVFLSSLKVINHKLCPCILLLAYFSLHTAMARLLFGKDAAGSILPLLFRNNFGISSIYAVVPVNDSAHR